MEHTNGCAAMRILDGFLFALFPQKVYEIDTLGKKITHIDKNKHGNETES